MFNKTFLVLCVVLLASDFCFGRDQGYRANTDFLAHESGSTGINGAKRDYIAPEINQQKRNDQNPPQLSTSLYTSNPTSNSGLLTSSTRPQSSGKRDYVTPTFTSVKPQATTATPPQQNSGIVNGKSTSKPHLSTSSYATNPTSNSGPFTSSTRHQNSGKRDYVAPTFTSVKPQATTAKSPQQNSGKVKDLINLYEGKNPNQNNPSTPSYSSIIKGNKANNQVTTGTTQSKTFATTKPLINFSTQTSSSVSTPKPFSYSAILKGNKASATPTVTTTTPKTINKPPPGTGSVKPGTAAAVLPSTLLNQNKNNQNSRPNNNSPTNAELEAISEELLRKDINNAAKYLTINYQEKTTSQSIDDKAPQPLLIVAPQVWDITTIKKFVPLLDNYERDTMTNEYVTPMERIEENEFMDAIMSTSVIRHLMSFFVNKGYVTPDPRQQRDFLKQMWFNLYSRGKGKLSSSGFEHVFVSEARNGEVLGLHNWIYFAKQEADNKINYLGYLKYLTLSDKGAVLKLHFNQQGSDKPVDTMFLGTSPELEMALYTLCFVTRADDDCNLKLGNKDVNMKTHTFRYRSKNYIGSAFPQI